jgi:hypothetical protein
MLFDGQLLVKINIVSENITILKENSCIDAQLNIWLIVQESKWNI